MSDIAKKNVKIQSFTVLKFLLRNFCNFFVKSGYSYTLPCYKTFCIYKVQYKHSVPDHYIASIKPGCKMVMLQVAKKPLEIKYKAFLLSKATFISVCCEILAICLPFTLCYYTGGKLLIPYPL